MTGNMTLGTRIRDARIKRGLTQDEVADLIGVLVNTVSRWERDAHPPRGAARKWLRANWPEVYASAADETDRVSLTGTD
jgi:transcriptional regulator with XRE-family HTH domain